MFKFLIRVLLDIALFTLLFFNLFVSKNNDTSFTLMVLIAFLILNIIVFRWKKVYSRDTFDTTVIVATLTGLVMLLFYAVGFYSGFNVNYSSMFKNYIKPSIWLTNFFIVMVCELLRNVKVGIDDKNKVRTYIPRAIMILVYMMVDLSIATKTYDLSSFTQLYEFFALIVVQSLSKNIFLDYLSGKYGVKPCLAYRIIMDLYIYFVPVTPKVNIFIKAVVLLVFPYILYMVIRTFSNQSEILPVSKKKKKEGIGTLISAIIFAVLVMLVSREFTYSMIAIGSGSMTGTINKGDAIVLKKYNKEKDNLKKGDIIVFYQRNTMIVHRIVKSYTINGEKAYQTKGDANESVDNWVVKESDLIGKVKFRILWIAWPSVWLNEIF